MYLLNGNKRIIWGVIIINNTQVEAWKNTGKIKPLLKVLKKEDSEEILKTVIAALGDIGDKRAVPAIFKAMEAKNRHSVSQIGEKTVLKIINDNNDIDYIIKMLNHRDKVIRKEANYVIWYIQVKKNNIDMLLKKLKHKNEKIRIGAAILLGNSFDERAVMPLIEAIKDKAVTKYAIISLGKIEDKRAVEPLIRFFEYPDISYDSYVATALGRIGDKRAIEPLIDRIFLYNDRLVRYNESLFESAAIAFTTFGEKCTIPALIHMYELAYEKRTQQQIIKTMGELGDASVVDFLIKGPLGYGKEDYFTRSEANRALVKIGADAVEPLIKMLKNIVGDIHSSRDDYYRHQEAIEVLARIGDKRAEEQLRYELKRNKINSMRYTLEWALEKMENG